MSIKGGVVFCGGCNPLYDRLALYQNLVQRFSTSISFSHYDASQPYDFILLVNGCGSECLFSESFPCPVALIRSGDLRAAEESIRKCCRENQL